MKVPGGVDLGPHHASQALGVQIGEQAVVEGPGGVDHRTERMIRGDGTDQPLEPIAFGDVACGDGDPLGTELPQLRLERLRARRLVAPAADEQQVARAVIGDEMACDESAEAAGAPGDQHRSIRVDRGRPLSALRLGDHQPRGEHRAPPQRELGLLGADRDRLRQRLARCLASVRVDHGEATGVL